MTRFDDLFGTKPLLIACIHLAALPGAPRFAGSMDVVFERALREATLFAKSGVGALIIENFNDRPFYPGAVPPETIAGIAAVSREIKRAVQIPIGINVLRNDASAAMAIATAVQAQFIRVNVHLGSVVSEQGILQGAGHLTLRLREQLKSEVMIFADVAVKHAAPLVDRGLATEAQDLAERGGADALIVSGARTGLSAAAADLEAVRGASPLPVLVGSGTNPGNLAALAAKANGFIVGSYFKEGGSAENEVSVERVEKFMETFRALR